MPEAARPIILIVEDEFVIRMMLAETLVDEGFSVREAGNGDEALAMLRTTPGISLLLTDLSLPGTMDGLALARQARTLASNLPIIFVTGRPDSIPADMLNARDEIVAKPYLPSQISAAAHRSLRK